ncbi:hypothetical protein NQD34_004078 [Periophthalmus magnuspinnatus]|nr:hypothetical protein NQD34_004078 [Periophthalmus magnuspinnatus]
MQAIGRRKFSVRQKQSRDSSGRASGLKKKRKKKGVTRADGGGGVRDKRRSKLKGTVSQHLGRAEVVGGQLKAHGSCFGEGIRVKHGSNRGRLGGSLWEGIRVKNKCSNRREAAVFLEGERQS